MCVEPAPDGRADADLATGARPATPTLPIGTVAVVDSMLSKRRRSNQAAAPDLGQSPSPLASPISPSHSPKVASPLGLRMESAAMGQARETGGVSDISFVLPIAMRPSSLSPAATGPAGARAAEPIAMRPSSLSAAATGMAGARAAEPTARTGDTGS